MSKYVERFELYFKFVYILITIFSMSSIIYYKVAWAYKAMTVINICLLLVIFLLNIKNKLWNRTFIALILLLLVTQLITTVIHYQHNLIGNIIEVAFMFSYCMITAISNPKIQERLFKYVTYAVQIISFLSALFVGFLIVSRISIFWKITSKSYFYGVSYGRIWALVNPNAAAIFIYISILSAILYIIKYRHKNHRLLKINIVIQLIQFSTQQSRGAILSCLIMIVLFVLFVSYEKKLYVRIIKVVVYSVIFLGIVFSINTLINSYFNHFDNEVIYLDENLKIYTPNSKLDIKTDEKLNIRLTESTTSGRIEIWKRAIMMGKVKPIFGYGIRNISLYFEQFFNTYLINNSIKGGSFHNIILTVFVAGGLLNVLVFLLLIGYLVVTFFRYLLKGNDQYIKVAIILFFGILSGQMFESTILYSTNFINFFFWTLTGYTLFLIKKEQLNIGTCREITNIEEIQKKELEILDYVKNVCDKLGLNYFLAYGTLLGAIRHKGFIPWDDDIDICMLRDDYEKLQDYLIANDNEAFGVMSYKNDPDYVYSFMKVYDKSTHLVERDVYIDKNIGLYIDIFPFDGYDDDEATRVKMRKLIKKRQLSCYTFAGIYNSRSVLSTIIRNFFILCFSFANTGRYAAKIERLSMSRKIADHEFCDYVGLKKMKRPTIRKEWFDKTVEVEFCGRLYKAPFEYDKVLRADYGDYMILPPVEQRVTHHSFRVWEKTASQSSE